MQVNFENQTYELKGLLNDTALLQDQNKNLLLCQGIKFSNNNELTAESFKTYKPEEAFSCESEFFYPAYKKVQRSFREEDAFNHICDIFQVKGVSESFEKYKQNGILMVENEKIAFTADDLSDLVDKFFDYHDCNIDENSQFESLICDYVDNYRDDLESQYQEQQSQAQKKGMSR